MYVCMQTQQAFCCLYTDRFIASPPTPLSHPYRISACWQVVQSYRGSEEGAETWTGEGTVCQGLHCPWRRTGHRKWRGGCDSRCLPYALANLTWFLFVVSLYTQYELVNCMQGGHAVHTHKYVCISTDVCMYIHVDWLYASVHVHFLYVHTATAEDTWTGALQWVQWEVEAAQVLWRITFLRITVCVCYYMQLSPFCQITINGL